MKKILWISLVSALLLCLPSAYAKTDFIQEFRIKLQVPPLYYIEIDAKQIVFSAEDFLTATVSGEEQIIIIKPAVHQIRTASNVPYGIWISTDKEYLSNGPGKIPFTRLEWSLDGKSWYQLSQIPQLMIKKPFNGIDLFYLNLRLRLNPFEIDPGIYSGEILYTVSQLQ